MGQFQSTSLNSYIFKHTLHITFFLLFFIPSKYFPLSSLCLYSSISFKSQLHFLSHKLIFGKAFLFLNKVCIKKSNCFFFFGKSLYIFAWHLKFFRHILHLKYTSFKLYFNLHFIQYIISILSSFFGLFWISLKYKLLEHFKHFIFSSFSDGQWYFLYFNINNFSNFLLLLKIGFLNLV